MSKQPGATQNKPRPTGLGAAVDRLVHMSPTLVGQIARARLRWPGRFKIEMGRVNGHSAGKVTVQRGQSALDQTLSLAHELGHLLNDKGLIRGGATFAEFVERNVNAKVREEGAAVVSEIVVRRELRKAKQQVPLHVARLASGGWVNLEAWVGKPAFLVWIKQVESELSAGESVEQFWRNEFKVKRMEDVWRGTVPHLHKTPGSSSLFQPGQTLLASADPLFVPGPNRRPVAHASSGQQAQRAGERLQAERKRAEEARRQAEQRRQAEERRMEQATQDRARQEALRKAAERAAEEQRKREAAAREQRAREQEARRKELEEAQHRAAAEAAARVRRPSPIIDRMRYGPGPSGPLPKRWRVITIIHGPAEIRPAQARPQTPGKKPGSWR